MVQAGCYKLVNAVNGKMYIGSSVNLARRKRCHYSYLRRDVHKNPYLQNAWNKYGEDAFTFEVILICDPEDCVTQEQAFIDTCEPEYNISPTAQNCLGVKHTLETRRKVSLAMKGKKKSPEHIASMAAGHVGLKHTPEARAKMSAAHKLLSDEHRAAISAANRARVVTDAQRAKVSAAHKGKKRSPEAFANMSAGQQRRWARVRGQEV